MARNGRGLRVRGARFAWAGLVLLLWLSRSDAAIGIYNWYPIPNDPSAEIHYRLNTDASSGQVLIRSHSDGSVIKTINLTGALLVKGPHHVRWLGDAQGGGSAPTGDYYAEISVSAPPVTEDPKHPFRNRHDFAYVGGGLAPFYGVAVDTNPANNNQTDPALSTYGLIYAADAAGKRILAFYPDAWTDSIENGQINAFREFPSRTQGNASSPWGLSAAEDGRIYSTARSYTASQGFHNYSPDGAIHLFGGQASTSQDTIAFGIAAEGTAFHLSSVGSSIERAKVNADYSYRDDLPADPFRIAKTVLSGAVSIFGFTAGPSPSENSPLWITNFSVTPSVSKWTWNGAAYERDASWVVTGDARGPGAVAVGVDISRNGADLMAVGCERRANNLVFLKASDGSFVRAYAPSQTMVHNVEFDAAGNVVMDCGGDSRSNKQRLVSIFFPEDNGSSDTRQTIPFHHTYGNLPPEVLSGTADPDTIRENGLDAAEFTVVVRDSDGQGSIASVTADLSPLGGEPEAAFTLDAILDTQTARYVLREVRAQPSTRAGQHSIAVQARDSAGGTATESIALEVTGGIISGTAAHEVAGFPIGGATITLADTVSGNVYTAVTSSDAGSVGAFEASVNPGCYTVFASKAGYGVSPAVSGLVVEQDQTVSGAQPLLGSLTVAAALGAAEGSTVCVEASVVAPPAAADWAAGGQKGFSDDDAAGASFKYYIRDASGGPSPIAGIKVDDGVNKPARADVVIVEGRRLYPNGHERNLQDVTNFHNRGPGSDPLAPEPAGLSSLVRLSNNLDYEGWGRYVQFEDATVVPGSQYETPTTVGFRVTDSTTTEQWTVKVWKSLGLSLADMPRDNYVLPLKALVTRMGLYDQNCLEPSRPEDIMIPPVKAATPGGVKQVLDGLLVRFTDPQVVTLAEDGFFYAQDAEGNSGIRVASGEQVAAGDAVEISGEMATSPLGERFIDYATVSVTGTGTTPVRLLPHKSLGGTGYVDGNGILTEGLLVRIYGWVSWTDYLDNYFLVDDGSHVDAADVQTGVKVINTPYLLIPGQFCLVTGVVTPELKEGKRIRVLRGRQTLEDLTVVE